MPSEGRLPPRRRARRVVYKLVSDFLTDVRSGRVRYGDMKELAAAASLFRDDHRWKHWSDRDVDVDEFKEAMREVADEMMRALHGRGAYGPRNAAGKSFRKGPVRG